MKKILLLSSILLFICFFSKAQDFIKYSGDTEKSLIVSAKTADDFLRLSLASELSDGDAQILYNNLIQQLKQLDLVSIAGDKSDHRLKKLYDVLHSHFLKKYNPSAHFGDFIVNGEYDDISATILYAYVLETLSVPYHIVQYPAHLFVIANPGTDDVKFETIDPSSGVFFINADSKQKNVMNLIKAGYLEQSYVIRVGVEKAFDDFVYGKEEVEFKEAIGSLYFNRALEELNADVAASAYSDICKSDMLYPDKKNEYFKNLALLDMAQNFKFNDMSDWRALTMLVNYKGASDNIKNYATEVFQNLMVNKLINAGQKDKVAEVYNYLHANITDTAVKKQMAKEYFFESAHYYVITNDYDQALNCMEAAYPLDPGNPLIASTLTQMIKEKYGRMAPTVQNLAIYNTYVVQHPALRNNAIIASIYEFYYSILGQMGYLSGNVVTGEKYMKMMTDELDAHPDVSERNHEAVAGIFAKASIYYFRKQQRQKAIEVLKAGLKYEPTSDELQRKLTADSGH